LQRQHPVYLLAYSQILRRQTGDVTWIPNLHITPAHMYFWHNFVGNNSVSSLHTWNRKVVPVSGFLLNPISWQGPKYPFLFILTHVYFPSFRQHERLEFLFFSILFEASSFLTDGKIFPSSATTCSGEWLPELN
jgi:hypothetical protein